jgi:hypothetical protein
MLTIDATGAGNSMKYECNAASRATRPLPHKTKDSLNFYHNQPCAAKPMATRSMSEAGTSASADFSPLSPHRVFVTGLIARLRRRLHESRVRNPQESNGERRFESFGTLGDAPFDHFLGLRLRM